MPRDTDVLRSARGFMRAHPFIARLTFGKTSDAGGQVIAADVALSG
jgi:hypothetical protein